MLSLDFKQSSPNHRRLCLKNGKFSKHIVETQNCLLSGKLPKSFDNFFLRCSDIHSDPTRFSKSECLYMPRFKGVKYGLNSISSICVNS